MDNSADINSHFEPNASQAPTRLLLHACCGPCSLEPLRVLSQRNIVSVIHFSNSNIAPFEEYELRKDAIAEYAQAEGIEIVFDEYDNESWIGCAGKIGAAKPDSDKRRARCRACYRLRLEASARYAAEHGFDGLGTTLSVSPYQYGDIILEELVRACEKYDITAFFEDYSPLYPQATKRSKVAGMYRQNYCGCLFSKTEAEEERKERKAAREAAKAARQAESAEAQAQAAREMSQRREQRREYDAKQAKKRAILKALREERRSCE